VMVLLAVSLLSFSLLYLTGDPAAALLPVSSLTSAELEKFREEMGFKDPLYVQYGRFAARAVHGDFGNSLRQNVPALDIVVSRVPNTLILAGATLLLAIVIAVPAGIASAVVQSRAWNRLILGVVLVGQSMPTFWLGLILIIVFAVMLQWVPPGGSERWEDLVLPMITLAAYPIAQLTRALRAGLSTVLREDYVKVAYSKGLSPLVVVSKHGMKNAAIPALTMFALQVRNVLGGAIIVETVFAWNGLGRLLVSAITTKDFPVVQVAVIFIAMTIVLTNVVVDVLYSFLDPRIRLS
jgi:peptide/nickel transport system permease protein